MLMYSVIMYIMSSAVNLKRDKSILYSRLLIITLLYAGILAYNILYLLFLTKGLGIFGGLFHVSSLSCTFNIFLLLVSLAIVFLTSFYPRKVWVKENSTIYKMIFSKFTFNKNKILNIMGEQFRIIEYSLILLFILVGGVFLMGTSDLVSIFLSIELQSYGLYIVSTIYRNSESATSAGLTYFLLGALASCFILLATSILYANSGCTSLDNLYVVSNISETYKGMDQNNISMINWYSAHYIHLSLTILSVGFLFKVSAAPFHFWSPDVYDAVPTIVTTFISIVAKITIFIFFLELVNYTYKSLYVSGYTWTATFLISSLLSLIIGTVLGLTQSRIKRLFAYSTISHIGFMLLALCINSVESIQAFLFYLAQYSISNLNSFMILISVGYSLYWYIYKNDNLNENLEKEGENVGKINSKERNNSPIQLINQLKGYFFINPILALSMAITLFSFAGIPPLMGFFAKFMVLSASIDNGYVFMSIIAILTSVIGGVYYLAIIKQIFFEKTQYILNPYLNFLNLIGFSKDNNLHSNSKVSFSINNVVLSSSLTIIISILTIIILLFIFLPSEVLNICNILSLVIFNC